MLSPVSADFLLLGFLFGAFFFFGAAEPRPPNMVMSWLRTVMPAGEVGVGTMTNAWALHARDTMRSVRSKQGEGGVMR